MRLKAKPVSVTQADTRLADMLEITDQSIALAFRMPFRRRTLLKQRSKVR